MTYKQHKWPNIAEPKNFNALETALDLAAGKECIWQTISPNVRIYGEILGNMFSKAGDIAHVMREFRVELITKMEIFKQDNNNFAVFLEMIEDKGQELSCVVSFSWTQELTKYPVIDFILVLADRKWTRETDSEASSIAKERNLSRLTSSGTKFSYRQENSNIVKIESSYISLTPINSRFYAGVIPTTTPIKARLSSNIAPASTNQMQKNQNGKENDDETGKDRKEKKVEKKERKKKKSAIDTRVELPDITAFAFPRENVHIDKKPKSTRAWCCLGREESREGDARGAAEVESGEEGDREDEDDMEGGEGIGDDGLNIVDEDTDDNKNKGEKMDKNAKKQKKKKRKLFNARKEIIL